MASFATSIAMMDAGVPLKSPVAGIAMGLVKEGNLLLLQPTFWVMKIILVIWFKVVGTQEGVTALQMDIKIQGITAEIMETALEQANR